MHVSLGLGQQTVSEFFTLEASCYYGCLETGAGNCEEICRVPSFSATGTAEKPKASNLQWWILGAFGVVALLVIRD
jgi:hypothetical protein